MSIDISRIFLTNVSTGKPVEGELWDQITEKQLGDWEAEWQPAVTEALKRLNHAGVGRPNWPQSRHWDWRQKTKAIQGLLAYPGVSVMCEGVTQGLMIVNTSSYRCRIPAQAGRELVYVEFLENAPWNRKELLLQPRFRGVGSILVGTAIQLSLAEGFKGRIGLHSLPQANPWYANTCGMTDLGIDTDKQGLRYFEMTPAQAEAFFAKGS